MRSAPDTVTLTAHSLSVLSEGVALIDSRGTITAANAALERLLDMNQEQIVGANVLDPPWEMMSATNVAVFPTESPVARALAGDGSDRRGDGLHPVRAAFRLGPTPGRAAGRHGARSRPDDGPRRPHVGGRCRTEPAPVDVHRRPDGPREPRPDHPPGGTGARGVRWKSRAGRRPARGHRRVPGHQRHVRPRSRRRSAGGDRRPTPRPGRPACRRSAVWGSTNSCSSCVVTTPAWPSTPGCGTSAKRYSAASRQLSPRTAWSCT